MMNNKQVSQNIIEDNESKYDEKIHIPMLIEALSRGEGIEAFCDDADICESTFKNWRKRYPKFKKAYARGIVRGKRLWLSLPFSSQTKDTVEFRSWRLVAQNRYGFGKHELEEADSDNFPDKSKKLQEALIDQTIDPVQYSAIMSGYYTEIKAQQEYLELQKKQESETTPIAQMDKDEMIQELTGFLKGITYEED